MELAVINSAGKKTTKKVSLNDSIFGIEPNDHSIYLDVKQIMANKRQGTSKSKERAEISGSTRKLKKQKGTGTARVGSIKSPLLRGGGTVFGPRPRNYGFKLNKKVKKLARKSALTYKAKENSILILEDLKFDVVKTATYVEMLKNLKVDTSKTLVVLPEANKNVHLSSRNVGNTKVIVASDLNTYDVLNAKSLIICEGSIGKIEELFN